MSVTRNRWIVLAVTAALVGCGRKPENGAAHYGLGRAATVQEVALVDIDAGPDGAGLPAGRGSVAEGAALYAAQCANCHGAKGEGMPPAYPALVGRDPAGESFEFAKDPKITKTIGNYWPNAVSLFDYLRRAMPHTAPGSLDNAQVYALTAHLLSANGILAPTATLDSASLMQVKMPAADRFVPDDRRGGRTIR
jgi:mono/diheme cytochrome c family protein